MVLNNTDPMDELRGISISELAGLTPIPLIPAPKKLAIPAIERGVKMPLALRSLGYGAHMISFPFRFPYGKG